MCFALKNIYKRRHDRKSTIIQEKQGCLWKILIEKKLWKKHKKNENNFFFSHIFYDTEGIVTRV